MPAAAGVAAVDRALAILDAFTDNDRKLTLAELAKRTGLYKSTVIRLAKSLEKAHYLLRSEDGTYRLGSKLLSLGALYQKNFGTAEIVPQVLREIVDELQEGASFYVRDEAQRLCLHRIESPRAVRDSIHVGDRLPLTVGAAGHVILRLQRPDRRALRPDPQEHVLRLVRRARPGNRRGRLPGVRHGAEIHRRAQRFGAALPHRGDGRAEHPAGALPPGAQPLPRAGRRPRRTAVRRLVQAAQVQRAAHAPGAAKPYRAAASGARALR